MVASMQMIYGLGMWKNLCIWILGWSKTWSRSDNSSNSNKDDVDETREKCIEFQFRSLYVIKFCIVLRFIVMQNLYANEGNWSLFTWSVTWLFTVECWLKEMARFSIFTSTASVNLWIRVQRMTQDINEQYAGNLNSCQSHLLHVIIQLGPI